MSQNFSVIFLTKIDSTNNYAKNLINKTGANEWTVIITDNQTSGRGQQGNKWISNPYENLTFSVILTPDFLNPAMQFNLNKTISIAIIDFLKNYIENVFIKWPNDIYVNDKKIGGILIENIICGDKYVFCIAGIGININQKKFPNEINESSTSLIRHTGKKIKVENCLYQILNCLFRRYNELKNNNQSIDNEYIKNLYLFQKKAKFKIKNNITEATIKGVDQYGRLILETNNNNILCNFKEVTF